MTKLYHETSLERARAIVASQVITGADVLPTSHEAYPHFYPDGVPRQRNCLDCEHEVTLIFEVNFEAVEMEVHVPDGGFPVNTVIIMTGIDGEVRQAIIAPGSKPLALVGFEAAGGQDLSQKGWSELQQACERRVQVHSAFRDARFRRGRQLK